MNDLQLDKILHLFTDDGGGRYGFSVPFYRDGHLQATDAHVLIGVSSSDRRNYPTTTERTPSNGLDILNGKDVSTGEPIDYKSVTVSVDSCRLSDGQINGRERERLVKQTRPCAHCKGNMEYKCLCVCGHEHECDNCEDGTETFQYMTGTAIEVRIGTAMVDYWRWETLLKACDIAKVTEIEVGFASNRDPVLVRAGDMKMAIVPLIAGDPEFVLVEGA